MDKRHIGEGTARMAVYGIAKDGSPARHSIQVNWFQRDPGGGTICVIPVPESGPSQSAVTRADEADAGCC